MSKLIIDLEEKLKKLKSSNNLLAIKAEFEAEGTRIEELSIISFLCSKYSIPLTLKIGGTCAKRDIYEAFQVGANNILVPMVESDFSLEYFINCYESFKSNFESFNNCPSISINIESIKGIENLDLIIEKINKMSQKFEFIVIGRSDLASSVRILDVNSNSILDLTKKIIKKSYKNNIKVAIGGNLTYDSYDFLKHFNQNELEAFESRKCTFFNSNNLDRNTFKEIINKALEFELSWLNLKRNMYSVRSEEENLRIFKIKERFKNK